MGMPMFSSVMADWNIDPDCRQNRKNGPVKTRKMTAAERKKYGLPSGKKKKGIICVPIMARKKPPHNRKMSDEQLRAEIAIHGTDRAAQEVIAEKYGYTSYWQVGKRIRQLEEVGSDGKVKYGGSVET